MTARTFNRLAVVWAVLALVAAMGFDWRGDLPALFAAGGFLLGSVVFRLYAVWLDVDEMVEEEPAAPAPRHRAFCYGPIGELLCDPWEHEGDGDSAPKPSGGEA